MKDSKLKELFLDTLPSGIAIAVMLVALVINVIPHFKEYISDTALLQTLVSVVIVSMLFALMRINYILRGFKADGLPVPAAYLDAANIQGLVSGTKENEKLIVYIGYLDEKIYSAIRAGDIHRKGNIQLIYGLNTIECLVDYCSWDELGLRDGFVVSMLPVDSILAVRSSHGECSKISVLRRYVNGTGMYALELAQYKGYLNEISHSFEQLYMEKGITIRSKSMLNFFREYSNERGLLKTFTASGEKVEIRHRGELFDRCTSLIKNAQVALNAIDMTPVEKWNTDQVFFAYIEAHKNASVELKTRIRVFGKEEVNNNKERYREYMKRMSEAGVMLSFLDNIEFDSKDYRKEGMLLIDEEVLITFIKPESGSRFGVIDFSKQAIDAAKEMVVELARFTISPADFEKKYLVHDIDER